MNPKQEMIVDIARSLGWGAEAVSGWRKKGRVPENCRWRLYIAARKVGLHLDEGDFTGWATTRGPRAAGKGDTAGAAGAPSLASVN